ncbi:TPA: baseplate J/gp47 family protein [Klebsiella pneumoniae]|nr:baseplate J/gp47 family protein [Klebsiella pneumoniae]
MLQTSIDLSQIPQPDIVEVPDFETVLTDVKELIVSAMPAELQSSVSAVLDLESEPLAALAQAFAYREIHLLQRINEAVRAVLLSSSLNHDLDQIAADFDMERLVITEATEDADAVYESDDELRQRILLSWGRLSTAGARNAYHYFAKTADPDVLDVRAYGPETHGQEGRVYLYVLSRTGDGTAPQALLDTVREAVNQEDVRPITDYVRDFVRSAEIVAYEVEADIYVPYGVDTDVVLEKARAALDVYNASVHTINATAACSGIDGALHQDDVVTVDLKSPAADVVTVMGQAPWCTKITLNAMVMDYDR